LGSADFTIVAVACVAGAPTLSTQLRPAWRRVVGLPTYAKISAVFAIASLTFSNILLTRSWILEMMSPMNGVWLASSSSPLISPMRELAPARISWTFEVECATSEALSRPLPDGPPLREEDGPAAPGPNALEGRLGDPDGVPCGPCGIR